MAMLTAMISIAASTTALMMTVAAAAVEWRCGVEFLMQIG